MSSVDGGLRRRQLERAIDRDRAELALALEELRAIARARLSLGRRVAARPAAWLWGAFVVGFCVGLRA